MEVSVSRRNQPYSLQWIVRLLLVLTVVLSVVRIRKSVGTLDTAILLKPLVDNISGSPDLGNKQRDSFGSPSVKDVRKDDHVDRENGTRKMQAAEKDVDMQRSTEKFVPTFHEKAKVSNTLHKKIKNNTTLPVAMPNPPTSLERGNPTNERIAILVRSMDPIRSVVLERLIQIAKVLSWKKFQNYDFHLMVDQTKQNRTTNEYLQDYFRAHNASHLHPPTVFSMTEPMILKEFPRLAAGYVPGPLVDGSSGKCCGQSLLWQLLMPTFVTFVHYHQEYDYTWVVEDDLWSVGTPLVELFWA